MFPIHAPHIPDTREALAPYNFVPLPEQVVEAEVVPEEFRASHAQLPRHDCYIPGRHTGRIACTLTAASPLYVRCGYTPEEYARLAETPFEDLSEEDRRRRAQFFHFGDPEAPAVPGSSLRGMLRALMEIASYGKMEKVTDRPRFFFRAVAAQHDDPLKNPYEQIIGRFGRNVRAGFLEREGDRWYIRPARRIDGATFIKVKEWDKKARREIIPRTLQFTRLNEKGYRPQYVPCSFTTRQGRQGPLIDQIGPPGGVPNGRAGWLVTSGNMLETGDLARGARSPRTSHAVVPQETEPARLAIDPQAVADYRAGLTDFQREPPFDAEWGALVAGRPIFYCEPPRGQDVRFFGHSPNFRVPYRFPGSARAATPADFVPSNLQDPSKIDLAEAIFGFVRREKQKAGVQAAAGRVFVSDARLVPGQQGVLYNAPLTPQILGSPKPTTFQHYLVQPNVDKPQLKHYANKPVEETVVRGHKLYWHKGEQPAIGLPETQRDTSDSQKTLIRPVRPGTQFTFDIHFENLSDVELGALLWVLQLAEDERYRLKLGMGKPLGMGAVSIESTVYLGQRARRYEQLFAGDTWATGEDGPIGEDVRQRCLDAFERHVLGGSGEGARGYTRLEETLRIRCLLALLTWPGPPHEMTRYLEIERRVQDGFIPAARPVRANDPTVNEYRDRPVLPDPRQVAGVLSAEDIQQPGSARPRPPAAQPAQSPVTSPRSAAPAIPEVGAVFTGKILEIDEGHVLVEVPRFAPEQVIGVIRADMVGERKYREGNTARVEVVNVRRLKSGRIVLELRPAPR